MSEAHPRRPFEMNADIRRPTGQRAASLIALAIVAAALPGFVGGTETTVFGPRAYSGSGRPELSRQTFRVPAGASGYTLRVRNKGVLAALVVLNGRIVLRPSDFRDPPDRPGNDDRWEPEWERIRRDWRTDRNDRTKTLIEKPVTLRTGTNEIVVAFISRVGTSFTVEIAKPSPDTTPPVITMTVAPAPNAAGWNNTNVVVGFACSDAESGVATCPPAVTVSTEGAAQTVSRTAVDSAGNQATASVTLNIDKTAPMVTATQSRNPNANGWNNGPVTVTFGATDLLSGVSPGTITPAITLTADSANQSATGQATDRAGNLWTTTLAGINIDQASPSISVALNGPRAPSGIYTGPVTAHFTCADALSGLASCPPDQVFAAPGMGLTATGTAVDRAGNSRSVTSDAFEIVLGTPTITVTLGPPANANGWRNTAVTAHFTCQQNGSPLPGCPADQVVATEDANQTVTGSVTNGAGQTASVTSEPFSIDRTLPTIAVSLSGPITNGVYTGPVAAHFTCADALSGIGVCPPDRVIATIGANQTVAGTAIDRAGNNASVTSDPFTIVGLAITDFTPKSAAAGSVINVAGDGFASGGAPRVTLNKQGGGTIDAPVSSTTSTALSFVIPTGAASGAITITVNGQGASSSTPLTVVSSFSFTLSATPGSVGLFQGESAAFAVSIESTNGFTQLAALSVTDLPAGLTATFSPSQVTAGQTAVLTVAAPAGQAIASSTLSILATAAADGISLTQSATVTVIVQGATTSLIGRTVVSDTLQTPIAGVTVKLLGKNGNGGATTCSGTTVSDGAGNFALTGLGPECVGPQLVGYDGLTATSPEGRYAGVNLVYTLQAGQVTESPVLVHLPRIDDKETFLVRQNHTADQMFFYQSIPGLSVTVYRGTTFRLEDGSTPDPFPLVAVQVPVDRLPDAKPPVPTMLSAFIVAFQPANAVASQPAAVLYPNTLNTPPGTNMTLMTLDPTRGRMLPYGTATVSPGGAQIVPDLDPTSPGRRYGIVNFDWHGPMPPPIIPLPNPDPPNPVNPHPGGGGCDEGSDTDTYSGGGCKNGGDCESCKAGVNPVDVSSGLETVYHTDLRFGGQRGPVSLRRYYRTLSTFAGPFGIGTHHNYGYRLDTANFQSADLINLVTPDGNRFPFTKELTLAPLGAPAPAPNELRNYTNPAMIGAVMTVMPAEVLLRWKNGTVYRFVQPNPQFTPQLDSIVDPNGNRITITRNANNPNQISQITDPSGRGLRLTYDGASRITSVNDPIGRVVSYTYNTQATLETVTDPEGGVTRYEYDSENRMIRETDARGIVVAQNTYDVNGRVETQTQADGGVFLFEYTFVNPTIPNSPILATKVTDALGRHTVHRFTPAGFRTDSRLANGQLISLERHPLTNKIIARRPIGTDVVRTDLAYDYRGNLLTHTDASSRTTVHTYEATFNKITSIRDALGNTTSFTYDNRGNLRTRTDENSHTTFYAYDTAGLLTEVTDATGQRTRFEHDTFGNLVRITDALGNTTQFRFDGASRLVEVVDSLGRKKSIAYNGRDQVISETDAKGQTTRFAYDRVGNLLTVTDARNKTTTFVYDAMSRLLSRTDSLGNADARTYDSNRNMLSFRDRRGQTSTFAYDDLNRLVFERYADGAQVERRYDGFSRLSQAIDSGVHFGFDYDVTGGLLRSTGPSGAVQYKRDELGRVVSRQVSGQPVVTYSYDGRNLSTASMLGASVGFEYDGRNQPTVFNRSNGVSTNNSYDPVGRVLSIAHNRGTTPLQSLTYSYSTSGERISQQTSIAQAVATPAAAATYDDANRLVQGGSATFAYDDNGNLTSETGPAGVTTYSWDTRNRLVSLSMPSGQVAQFAYDFAGNLISQTETGPLRNIARAFVLDSLTNVAYQQSSAGDQFSVLTGRTIDSHLAIIRSETQFEFGITDAINSTVGTMDQAGQVKGLFVYDSFGKTQASGSDYPFKYTGRVPVADDFYYYRARFYSASVGRFIREDPTGVFADANLYRYAGGDPISMTDPLGLWPDLRREDFDTGPQHGDPRRYIPRGIEPGPEFGLDLQHVQFFRNFAHLVWDPTFIGSFTLSYSAGLGVECQQRTNYPASAFRPQDIFSNALGAALGALESAAWPWVRRYTGQ